MCFYNDYDWTAEVCTVSPTTTSALERVCMECGEIIKAGAVFTTIYMQESAECEECSSGSCKCDGKCCACATPDFGNTYDYQRCGQCDKFLQAIEALEVEEGCPPHSQRPGLEGLMEELRQRDVAGARPYVKKAIKMFPELKAHIAMLWRRMF